MHQKGAFNQPRLFTNSILTVYVCVTTTVLTSLIFSLPLVELTESRRFSEPARPIYAFKRDNPFVNNVLYPSFLPGKDTNQLPVNPAALPQTIPTSTNNNNMKFQQTASINPRIYSLFLRSSDPDQVFGYLDPMDFDASEFQPARVVDFEPEISEISFWEQKPKGPD